MTLKKDLIDTSNIQTNIPIKKDANKKSCVCGKMNYQVFQ